MSNIWPDTGTLATIAGITAAFSMTMFVFRIQRELEMKDKGEINWIPWADRLLIGAGLVALIFGILPLLIFGPTSLANRYVPPAACGASVTLIGGYIFAILAHYRFILDGHRKGPRINPEPNEKWIVIITVMSSISVFIYITLLHKIN